MKRLFLSLIVLLALVACEPLSTPPEQQHDQPEQPNSELDIEGYWYMVVENHIYTLDIRTGQAILVDYYYEDSTWQHDEKSVIYTISESEVVVQIAGQDTWRANIAVTGDVLSISNDDVAYIFIRYDGLEGSLQEVKREIEDSYIDETPIDSIITDDYFNSEVNVSAALCAVYISMIDAVAEQLNLENIRIEKRDLFGGPKSITPNAQEVLTVWEKWYKVASETKVIVDNIDRELFYSYYNEAVALKAFAYYNLAMLYGVVVEYESLDSCVIYNANEALDMVEDMLSSIGEVLGEEYRLSNDDIMALRAEVALYRGARQLAASLLTEGADFELPLDSARYPQYYTLFGDAITIYSESKIAFLKRECEGEDTAAEWLTLNEERYGYWAMLKRTEIATEVVGCEEFELLMPIPQFEIMRNPQLTQNVGY